MPPTQTENPLLAHGRAPRFDLITPEHVVPGITAILERARADLAELERAVEPTWEGTLGATRRLYEPLDYAWTIVLHLLSVQSSDELRAAVEEMEPDVTVFMTRLGQSRPLYDALRVLRDGSGWAALDAHRQRAVELSIRDMELTGVNLEGEARERFTAIESELAELSTAFGNAVLDSTKAYELLLTDPAEVDGLPASLLAQTAAAAAASGNEGATAEAGPWRITLDIPVYLPFVKHARRRDLRERLHRAFATRASTGEHDNGARIERILTLRCERAALLGYGTHAEVSLASKMAPDVAAVEALTAQLEAAARPVAERERVELTALARERLGDPAFELQPWDVSFWAERVREERFAFTDEELRPYFPLQSVLEGLFDLTQRLFGVEVQPTDGELPTWHPDVRTFRVVDGGGEELAGFYLDPYSRPEDKRGGAWMGAFLGRERRADGTLQLPLANLACNQTPPVGDVPSLMTHREVETLFHEFGHSLQHMLTTVEVPGIAGIDNVEWDACELASQFMENWCYHPTTVRSFARHHETGEPLPGELLDKVIAAKHHLAGNQCLYQVISGTADMQLHHRYEPGGAEAAHDVFARVAERITVLPRLAEARPLCSFGHLFAGGYAAGYYGYKWAEVLSSDAFGAFEEAGLDDAQQVSATGARYRDTVLALGASRPAMDVFCAFRGREPEIDALLRHSGLAEAG